MPSYVGTGIGCNKRIVLIALYKMNDSNTGCLLMKFVAAHISAYSHHNRKDEDNLAGSF